MGRGLEEGGHPLVFSGWKAPHRTPTPAFPAWFHPATLHLDLDERRGDLWMLALHPTAPLAT